jgi:large subunit ribosomal protein L24e
VVVLVVPALAPACRRSQRPARLPAPTRGSQDSTFEFEKRRNTPVRYDRELMGATIRAMKRVGEIQTAREERFYRNRMAGKKAAEKAQHALEIAQNIDLVQPAVTRKAQEVNVGEKVKAKAKNAGRMETE